MTDFFTKLYHRVHAEIDALAKEEPFSPVAHSDVQAPPTLENPTLDGLNQTLGGFLTPTASTGRAAPPSLLHSKPKIVVNPLFPESKPMSLDDEMPAIETTDSESSDKTAPTAGSKTSNETKTSTGVETKMTTGQVGTSPLVKVKTWFSFGRGEGQPAQRGTQTPTGGGTTTTRQGGNSPIDDGWFALGSHGQHAKHGMRDVSKGLKMVADVGADLNKTLFFGFVSCFVLGASFLVAILMYSLLSEGIIGKTCYLISIILVVVTMIATVVCASVRTFRAPLV